MKKPSLIFLIFLLLISSVASAVDLSMVPQYGDNETEAERDARMQWFRDAKFGFFITFGVSAIGKTEIGWGRRPPRPFDISERIHGPATPDPVYDNYYKEFNPEKFDADAVIKLAKDMGTKYVVMIAKHHDGFSMYDTEMSEYDVMATPYGKDLIGEIVEACRKHDMKIGIYYSTRDWYHEDYLVGDNKKYDEWQQAQVRELLTNYGDIDIMWFDSVGGQDWSKWDFESLFSMIYTLQPDIIINNRAANFIGFDRPRDQNQPDEKIVKMADGDFETPELQIGPMDLENDWETCMIVGKRWSYTGEIGFKTPSTTIQYLVSCVTGGGNLLLNFGPRPDGTITDAERLIAKEMGKWIKTHEEAIYGTEAGPLRNGAWGGTTHRGNTMYLFIAYFPEYGLALEPFENEILSARVMTGGEVEIEEKDEEFIIKVAPEDRNEYVTVLELTMKDPIESGKVVGGAKTSEALEATKGKLLTKEITLVAQGDKPGNSVEATKRNRANEIGDNVAHRLFTPWGPEPWVVVDLGEVMRVNLLEVQNSRGKWKTHKMDLYTSLDGENWEMVWSTNVPSEVWQIPLTRFLSGVDVVGRDVRYLKFIKNNDGNKIGQGVVLNGIRPYGSDGTELQQ